VLRIEMLPAAQGDALWIEYGSSTDVRRVLIDAGVRATYPAVKARAEQLPAGERRFELLVITHVDSDHIGGAPKLLDDHDLGLEADDVWFNAWRHFPGVADMLGPVEGEIVSAELDGLGWSWNAAFGGKAVVVPDDGDLPSHTLPGGLKLTLLSPTPAGLTRLKDEWKKVVEAAGLSPGVQDERLEEAAERRGVADLLGDGIDVDALAHEPLQGDRAPANGSTIAFLAEHDGTSCLFTGDSHPDVLEAGLRRLCRERQLERLPVTALKVPHHGSKHNVSLAALELVQTDRYLFSTNGNQTHHPDLQGVARTIVSSSDATLSFNYRVETTEPWNDPRLQTRHRYRAEYGDAGLVVEL
jgi:beta-lactamase superfamily II metal-dependent hydrolase